jgi:hypothetical protein
MFIYNSSNNISTIILGLCLGLYQFTNLPIYKFTSTPRHPPTPIYQFINLPMYQLTNLPIYQITELPSQPPHPTPTTIYQFTHLPLIALRMGSAARHACNTCTIRVGRISETSSLCGKPLRSRHKITTRPRIRHRCHDPFRWHRLMR